ncbi:exosortase Y [Mucilaginibacter sp.]
MKVGLNALNPALRFAITFVVLFALLYGFYLFYLGITVPGNLYSPFLDHHLNFISGLRFILIQSSSAVLQACGYPTKTTEFQLMVPAHNIIIIGYDCLGFGVMCFFTAFVLAYPKPLLQKLIFLGAGLLIIQLLNILRFILLTLHWHRSKVYIADQHTVFNIVIYVLIMASIFIWIRTSPPASGIHEN